MCKRISRISGSDFLTSNRPCLSGLIRLLLATILFVTGWSSFTTVVFGNEPHGAAQPVRLIRSDQGLVEFEVIADTPGFASRETGAGTYDVISIPGFFSYGRPGEAQLPHRTFLVAIPQGATYDVAALPLDETTFESKRIIPAGVSVEGKDGIDEEHIVPSESFYSKNESLPASPLLGTRESVMRNQRVLGIDISPTRYNPVSNTLVLYKRIRVSVSLRTGAVRPQTGTEIQKIDANATDALESLYRSTIVNYEQSRSWRARQVPRPVNQLRDSFSSSTNWCKISVKQRGIYKVTGTDLRTAGVSDLGSINPLTLRLFNGGGLELPAVREPASLDYWMKECAIEVFDGGDGRFDDNDYILFYGLGTDGWLDYFKTGSAALYTENLYTDKNIYWLTWNGTFVTNPEPLRIPSKGGAPLTPGAYSPPFFPARLHVEQNTFYDPTLAERNQRWEKWWWQALDSRDTGPQSYLYTFAAPNLEPAARCSLLVRLWAPCTFNVLFCPDDHMCSAFLNGQYVDQDSLYGVNSRLDLRERSARPRERHPCHHGGEAKGRDVSGVVRILLRQKDDRGQQLLRAFRSRHYRHCEISTQWCFGHCGVKTLQREGLFFTC